MSYTIQLNQTGTHSLEITEENLETIRRYALFHHLVDSNGYVDEDVLNKLRLNIRDLIATRSNCKDLLDLCIDVVYHDKMKAFGLNKLIQTYQEWEQANPEAPKEIEAENNREA